MYVISAILNLVCRGIDKMLRHFVIILFLSSKCTGVGIEYYDDTVLPQEQTEDQIISYTRRMSSDDVLKNSNAGEFNVTAYTESGNISNTNNTYDNITRRSLCATNFDTTLFNMSRDNSALRTLPKVTMFPSFDGTLKEYEYIYDEETEPYILRDNTQNPSLETETNASESNIKNSLTEFYNLDPAVQHVHLNTVHKYSKFSNVWYVLENLPCWELPLLYGEFGRQKQTYDVFLMHGGELKNVIEKVYTWEPYSEPNSVPLTYYTNKWCKSAPCYGDHTLCLFSDKYVSGICDEDYKVEVPTISEQIALVNTLNSMRNKVANGKSDRYSHLPPAANMKQIIYDYDLENFAKVWLLQCLPGPEPCSAIDEMSVNQLECTKFAKYCCTNTLSDRFKKCNPRPECFIPPVIGCLHIWFWNAGDNLTLTDIQCGHTSLRTYSTGQLLWAATYKIGCAYGINANGDVRVICNFSPGAPFALDARFYCGILKLKGGTKLPSEKNISDAKFLKSFGINIDHIVERKESEMRNVSEDLKLQFDENTNVYWGVEILHKIYKEGRIRNIFKDYKNGTRDMIARLVVKYKFIELNGARCDSDEPIYVTGNPGSLCVERGRRYQGLCYDYRDPTPGYRLVAVIAPIALFSLILYDLFSGIVRQTNY